jgi:hypothetical protein
MLGIDFDRDATCLMLIAVGFTLLGFLQLLDQSAKAAVVAAVMLAGGCGAALVSGSSRDLWMPLAVVAGVAFFFLALRSRCVRSLLRAGSLHAAVLLLTGPGLMVAIAWAWRGPPEIVLDVPPTNIVREEMLSAAEDRLATDRGHAVPLFALAQDGRPSGDEEWLRRWGESASVLRTGRADQHYNCHGWVFAAGRGWLHPSEVEAILRDNGYEPVTTPRAGDLIIYRGATGEAAHSGLVRVAAADGLILIESKWAWLGRFVHAPRDSPYGTEICYYRSGRCGHQLAAAGSEPHQAGAPGETEE